MKRRVQDMVKFATKGAFFEKLDFSSIDEKAQKVSEMIANRSGEGNAFLGWLDFASNLPEEEIERIIKTANRLRNNYEALVIVGIGGSYLGTKAVIEAMNGLYSQDNFEILYLGNTLSSSYTAQILQHLKNKKFAINVVSKSGTTTEPAVAFRILKCYLEEKYGHEYLKDAIVATTDKSRGALVKEAQTEGYETFVIPNNIGGRFSVLTPVGLLPIACAGIDIREFIRGIRDGEVAYAELDYRKNPAYLYAINRYFLNKVGKYPVEMFVTYEPQNKSILEWLKQLLDESEGKDGQGLLCTAASFTTDLHSMGQFIQQGTPCLFETILHVDKPVLDITVPYDKDNLDNLNYLSGRKLSEINHKAYIATLEAHTSSHTPATIVSIDEMTPYNIGNLMYFFFKATAFSAYMLEVNPFNQPGVEVYKTNMFKLLGKPGYENK